MKPEVVNIPVPIMLATTKIVAEKKPISLLSSILFSLFFKLFQVILKIRIQVTKISGSKDFLIGYTGKKGFSTNL
ncbi:MAG: hypothetical protein DRG73_09350 [Deltaproteobacteria bacterium]|nr:MAG: hypothetical protein DRG73_09350 [Deltaproteobacteria bacterium]